MSQHNSITPIIKPHEGIRLTPQGAHIAPTASATEIKAALREVFSVKNGIDFNLGDLANAHVQLTDGDIIELAAEIGIKAQDLAKVARVCRKVGIDTRRPEQLSLGLHEEVATLSDSEAQGEWLAAAEQGGMDATRLRKSIELGRVATSDDMEPAPTDDHKFESINPPINQLVVMFGKMRREGVLDAMDADQLFAIHEDLLPLVEIHDDITGRMSTEPGFTGTTIEA